MYKEPFIKKLKQARKDTGLTQMDVCTELKIPQSTLANYETGRTEPDIETLCKLIDFYEVSADWVLNTNKRNK